MRIGNDEQAIPSKIKGAEKRLKLDRRLHSRKTQLQRTRRRIDGRSCCTKGVLCKDVYALYLCVDTTRDSMDRDRPYICKIETV